MSSDRRKSHRFPASPERAEAILRVGDDSIPVRLLDESAVGFLLQVNSHPGVYEGELVWLNTDASWTKVRVARIQCTSSGVQLGLSRIDINAANVDPIDNALIDPKSRPNRFWRIPKNNRVPVITGLALLLTVVLVPLLHTSTTGRRGIPSNANHATLLSDGGLHGDPRESIREMGASVFIAPAMVRILALSRRQISHINTIVARSNQAVKLATETDSPYEEIRRFRLDAQQQARSVLNRRQQARWEEILQLLEKQYSIDH